MSSVSLSDTWRTTTFRLALLYGGIFTVGVFAVLTFIYYQTTNYINQQTDHILSAEFQSYSRLPENSLQEFVTDDITRDVRHINLLGLFSPDAQFLAGNIREIPAGIKINDHPKDTYINLSAATNKPVFSRALVGKLPNGDVILIGRVQLKLEEFRKVIFETLTGAGLILIIGTLLGAWLSLKPIKRIATLHEVSQKISKGETHLRLPVDGANDELDSLANIVNGMLDEIILRMRDIKSTSDNIAHNLSTPLTHLRTLLNRLLHAETSATNRETIEQAIDEADQLIFRFRALLRISEISGASRRAMFEKTDLKFILMSIQDLYMPLAQDKKVTLKIDLQNEVNQIMADKALLFEAILNLVDNAIKFTPVHGEVAIRLLNTKEGPIIEIEDNGSGISENELKLVMQPFYRGNNMQNVAGHGVGLSIVGAIVNLHGFDLHLSSTEGTTKAQLKCFSKPL